MTQGQNYDKTVHTPEADNRTMTNYEVIMDTCQTSTTPFVYQITTGGEGETRAWLSRDNISSSQGL